MGHIDRYSFQLSSAEDQLNKNIEMVKENFVAYVYNENARTTTWTHDRVFLNYVKHCNLWIASVVHKVGKSSQSQLVCLTAFSYAQRIATLCPNYSKTNTLFWPLWKKS